MVNYREIRDGDVFRLDTRPVKVMGPVDPRRPVRVMLLDSYTRAFCSLSDLVKI